MSYARPKYTSTELSVLKQRTSIGYKRLRCKVCRCTFNERSGTVFNSLEYPTDLVLIKDKLPLQIQQGVGSQSSM